MFLLPAHPAAAQTVIWSTTLTVDQDGNRFGCDTNRATQDNCSSALADDDFVYKGVTYRVRTLTYFSAQKIVLLSLNPSPLGRLAGLELHLGTTRVALGTEQGSIRATNVDPQWTDNQQVAVTLVDPTPVVAPPPPAAGTTIWSTTLTVAEGNADYPGYFGCDPILVVCSAALADDDFVYKGVTYRARQLFWRNSSRNVSLSFAPTVVRSNLAGLELHLDTTKLTLGTFTRDGAAGTRWTNVNLQWTDNQQVTVRLVEPPPPPPVSLTLSATDTAPREGGGPVTVVAALDKTFSNEVHVNVLLRGTATWGEGSQALAAGADYWTPAPAGVERGFWFGEAPSDSVQAINLLKIPAGLKSAIFTVHIVDDAHNDDGETIEIEAQAYENIGYTATVTHGQHTLCPQGQTCQVPASWMKFVTGASDNLTLTIRNHEDAETEAARLAALAAAEAERQRLAALRAAAGGPLSGLALTAGSQAVALVPAFSPGVTYYRAEVPLGTTGVSLAPSWGAEAELRGPPSVLALSRGGATILARTQVHASGGAAALSPAGPTRLELTVIEPDGSGQPLQGTTTTYHVEVVGAAAQTATAGGPLSGLALTAGSQAVALVPAFSPGVTRYRAEVPAGTREVSLAPSWGGSPTVWARSRRPVPHLTLLSRQRVGASGTAAALSLSPDGPTRLEVTVLDAGWTTTDYRIEVVEAAAAQTVAVAFGNVPPEHDGRTAFALEVQSGSEPAPEAFTVTNGKVTGVESLDPVLWRVRVKPKSWKDVTVALGEASATVRGPARIRVADARAKEDKDASLDFAVSLSRAASGPVSVDYATADGTATAGVDYTAASGTLTFAAGETEKTVSVALLDDAIDEGKETFTLELSNPRGAFLRAMHREAKGVIRNDDPLQQAWLGRFGRAAASDAIAAVTARFETPRAAGSHLTFAGQRLDLSGEGVGDGAGLANAVAGLARAFGAEAAPAATGDPWNDPAAAPARAMSTRELLLGTSFRAVLGSGAGSQLTSWGQGASVSQFSGAVPGLSLSGESATGALGMDYERGALLAGFAMTHSLGAGTAHGAGRTYAMGSSVTTMLPYARFALGERISAWGMAGTGAGGLTLDLDDAAAQRYRTDLSMTLAAAGVRGDLLAPTEAGGFALALKADAFWVRTESDALSTPGVGNLAAARADASRLRAVLDGSRTFALAGGATLAPSLELGVRHDGGDAETGTGLELGAGLGFADPSRGLDMALRVHGIAAHAGDGYREWGVSGSLRLAPGAAGRGLSMSLTPSYGADPGGSERLWALPDAHALAANGDAPASSRLDTELGYGLPVFGGGFTGTPNVGLGLSDTARDYRLGWRLTPAAGGDTGFALSLDATRRESVADGGAEHGVMLRARTSW